MSSAPPPPTPPALPVFPCHPLIATAPPPLQDWVAQVNGAEAEYWKLSGGSRVGYSDEILGFDCGGQQLVLEVQRGGGQRGRGPIRIELGGIDSYSPHAGGHSLRPLLPLWPRPHWRLPSLP